MDKLYQTSIEIIKKYQHPGGGYVACPNFENYNFSWLRDGSFIAAAMDMAGEHDSAADFHAWVNGVVAEHAHKIDKIEKALQNGDKLNDHDFLFTRYKLDGSEDYEDEDWGNFQYDGYGTWLWALKEHLTRSGKQDQIKEFAAQIHTITRYLSLVWKLPNYDCWEEHPELLHTYSISAAYGGLQTVLDMAEKMGLTDVDAAQIKATLKEMKDFVLQNGVSDGTLLKHISPDPSANPLSDSGLDSSLLGACVPYGMFGLQDELSRHTIEQVAEQLTTPTGGVYRYLKDTYYGGGVWILLTAWLGWAECLLGNQDSARKRLDWIRAQANEQNWLPEQVEEDLLAPKYLQHWENEWGKSATPLLWSHAMYIILCEALEK